MSANIYCCYEKIVFSIVILKSKTENCVLSCCHKILLNLGNGNKCFNKMQTIHRNFVCSLFQAIFYITLVNSYACYEKDTFSTKLHPK